MKVTFKTICGIALLLFGTIWLLDLVGLLRVNVFFKGWWSLFIIIPSLAGLFSDRRKAEPIIGLVVGVFFLLAEQDVIFWGHIWKYILAIMAIVWGWSLIFDKGLPKPKQNTIEPDNKPSEGETPQQ